MKTKELNEWFNNLDTEELALIFPFEYEDTMKSCDPGVNINTFYKEAKRMWRAMSKEEKERHYNELEN